MHIEFIKKKLYVSLLFQLEGGWGWTDRVCAIELGENRYQIGQEYKKLKKKQSVELGKKTIMSVKPLQIVSLTKFSYAPAHWRKGSYTLRNNFEVSEKKAKIGAALRCMIMMHV